MFALADVKPQRQFVDWCFWLASIRLELILLGPMVIHEIQNLFITYILISQTSI